MTPEMAREMAREQAQKTNYKPGYDPFQTFVSIKFDLPKINSVEQKTIAQQNLRLSPESCLGRVAVVGAILEQHHHATLQFGEVWDDFFKNNLLEQLRNDSANMDNPEFMRELLMYEEPHAVVVHNGQQFEPLSLEFGELVEHPRVATFPFWEGVAASATVSEAWLKEDLDEKMLLLEKAEEICPGLILTQEGMVHIHELKGRILQAVHILRLCLTSRPCARTLWVMHLLTGDQGYYWKMIDTYSKNIIPYIIGGE